MVNETNRNKIVELARKAGIEPARLKEIENGCEEERVLDILGGQIADANRLGDTLVLSNIDACVAAERIAIDCVLGSAKID